MADRMVPTSAAAAHLALVDLAKSEAISQGDLARALPLITECGARVLKVGRASLWMLSEDGGRLECHDLYVLDDDTHAHGAILERADYPAYFEALDASRSIQACDAHQDPATFEFSADYLTPLGIGAMLDAPIRRAGHMAGVLCLEHLGGVRDWNSEAAWFAAALADVANLALTNHERAQAEAALRASETTLRTIVDNANDIIFTLDVNGVIRFISPSVEPFLGYRPEELEGRPFEEFVHPDDQQACRDNTRLAIEEPEQRTPVTYRIRGRAGGWRWQETIAAVAGDSAETFRVIGVTRDVTREQELKAEQEALEHQLRQSQKMEAVGRLAGGIAHDFNNLLTVINGISETALSTPELPEEQRAYVQMILDAGQRAADLTRQLLAFSRKQVLHMKLLDLRELLRADRELLRRLLPEDIDLQMELPDAPVPIYADASQLEQVLMNLAVNASDAMADGGSLRIELLPPTPDASGPGEVRLRVRDSGCGMDASTIQAIFEPFFTTKGDQGGSGLGLAVTFGIIKQHRGNITVDSTPGRGTCFEISFPASAMPLPEPEPDLASRPGEADAEAIDGTRILVVEDEPSVRQFICDGLAACGFPITEAATPADALARISETPESWDLLITDLIMPEINGVELYDRARRIAPRLEVLFVSGYPRDVLTERTRVTLQHYLAKPFSVRELRERIADVMRGRPEIPEDIRVGA